MNDQYQPLAVEAGSTLPTRRPTFEPGIRAQDRPGTSDTWRGPGTVIDADALVVTVRHDSGEVTSWDPSEVEHIGDEPAQPTPPLAVGTSVLWTDPRTSNTDPAPGEVVQILPDPDAYPIVVRWSDGFLGRYARTELKAATL